MEKKKICFVAQFPPPIHGLSKAVDTLYHSRLQDEFEFEKIDISNNKRFLQTYNQIRKSDADLFYFTISQTKGGNFRDLMILNLLKRQNKKCLIHLHGGHYRILVDEELGQCQRKKNYRCIRELEGAIVLGNSLKSIFVGMLPENRIHVVPNCVDDSYLMSEEEFSEKLMEEKGQEKTHVLYLSNFIKSKGYMEVLQMAVMEKKKETSSFHFDFAGKFFAEEDEKEFFSYIKKNSIEEYVTYHGIVSGEEKSKLLKKCKFFILLTTYPNEGQPISIIEAMGNGMVIVTTDHAGIPDVVQDSVNGIVCDKNKIDVSDVYHKMQRINDDSEKMKTLLSCNRKTVLNEYTQTCYINNLEKIFSKL